MKPNITEKTLRQFVAEVSDRHYPMTETVIAANAAQAAALAEACMQISLDNQVDTLDWQDITARIEQMAHIKDTLLEWCNQEVNLTVDYLADEKNLLIGDRQALCDYSAEIGRYSVEAAMVLQDFRAFIFEPLRADLEMTINLLAGIAKTAILLLDSNLYAQGDKSLIKEYTPLRDELQEQFDQLKLMPQLANGRA